MPPLGFGHLPQNGGMEYVPEDRDQFLVQTPYGRGTVRRTRKEYKSNQEPVVMREIELTDWIKPKATKGIQKPSILYSPTEFPSVPPEVGSHVMTIFGHGKVVELRRNNDNEGVITTVVVRISSWRLAGRSLVTCYLASSSVQVLRPQTVYEMNAYDKVEHAQELKQQANVQFTAKNYNAALELYAQAVDTVRYVQHTRDSSNELRADLLVVMITCCNNAATCCLKLDEWDRAQKFGRNALVLLDALLEKKGSSKIHELLNREGNSDSQLFGTWKVKSYLVVARGLAQQHEAQQAMDMLKKALEVIATYKMENDSMYQQLVTQEKELRRLYAICKERFKAERQLEKKRAMAMFGGGGLSEEKKDTDHKTNGDDENGTPTKVQDAKSAPTATPATSPASTVSLTAASVPGILTSENENEDKSGNRVRASRRVSFADGSRPGEELEDDEPGFFTEHKEALLLMGGIAVGSFLVQALLRRRA
jgi:tetratricopeptide (TPR) repeat protein